MELGGKHLNTAHECAGKGGRVMDDMKREAEKVIGFEEYIETMNTVDRRRAGGKTYNPKDGPLTEEREMAVPMDDMKREAEEVIGFEEYPKVSSKDPWAHRSQGMKCKTCMWFAPKVRDNTSHIDLGRCRRRSPTMNGYPVVFVNDWCGDHKLVESK